MADFAVFSDSSCDLSAETTSELNVSIISYFVSLDGKNYLREGIDITHSEFYKRLRRENLYPKTSLPPIQDYIDAFKPALNAGKDILCICLTTKFSGSCQCALNAAELCKGQYPNNKIVVMDSAQVTCGQGVMVREAALLQKQGKTIDETVAELELLKTKIRIIFTVDSLNYLQKGGRVGKASALAGSLLNIKPIIYAKDGELIPHSKVRGRNKAILKLIDIALKEVGEEKDAYEFRLLSADCDDEVLVLRDLLEKEHGIKITMPVTNIGVTIGAHTGPTALGILYRKKV